MCGLCGTLGVAAHWTDPAGEAGQVRAAAAERRHRVAVANRVLGLFGLKLRDWADRFTLTSATGRAAVVPHLGAVWPEAERLAGRPCDPLDPDVIAKLEAGAGKG